MKKYLSYSVLMMFLVLTFCVTASAEDCSSIGILSDLKAQNASVDLLDDVTLDQARAKEDYYLKMTYPTDYASDPSYPTSSFNYSLWYDFYNSQGVKVHDAYLSEAVGIRYIGLGDPTKARFFVDPASSGIRKEISLFEFDWATGKARIQNTERVMFVSLDATSHWQGFINVPGYGGMTGLPIGGPQYNPRKIMIR